MNRIIFTPSIPIMIGALPKRLKKIKFIEVGPRDGLQNESKMLTIEQKQVFITQLADTGIQHIEAGSLVNYNKVPTMKGTREVLSTLKGKHDTHFSVLVPHVKELASLPAAVSEIVLFASVSNTFNQKNIGTNVEGAFARFGAIKEYLMNNHLSHIKLRGSISCCWGCPYEGDISRDTLFRMITQYSNLGCETIDICDTIGVATPQTTKELLEEILERFPSRYFSLHLHDNNGKAIDSALVGCSMGIDTLQGSIGGIGGCPFSSKRSANVNSLELLTKLKEERYDTGIDLYKLKEVQRWIQHILK